jgi:hypothetical protein
VKCDLSIGPDELARFWLGDLDERDATTLEDHVFECTACHEVLRGLAAIESGVRVAMTFDRLPPLPTPERLAELRASGMRLVVLNLAPGDVVTRHMDLEVDGIVYLLHAPLSAVAQVDRTKGDVVLACGRHTAEVAPESLVRLFDGNEKNLLAEYRLVHHAVESL